MGCGSDEVPVAGPRVAEPDTRQVVASAEAPDRPIRLGGQPNFRDLGGYETADGRTVKPGEIYRSGELPHLTDEDVAKLAELKIRAVVNLLLPEEIEVNGRDRLPEGAQEVPEPIYGERAAELIMVTQSAIQLADFDKIPPEMNPRVSPAPARGG